MVKNGIILDHVISRDRIKVDKPKTDLIVNIFPLIYMKEMRFFLGHSVSIVISLRNFVR